MDGPLKTENTLHDVPDERMVSWSNHGDSNWPQLFHKPNLSSGTAETRAVCFGLKIYNLY